MKEELIKSWEIFDNIDKYEWERQILEVRYGIKLSERVDAIMVHGLGRGQHIRLSIGATSPKTGKRWIYLRDARRGKLLRREEAEG